jgi:tetratricopeptide (TPR) repeat protein
MTERFKKAISKGVASFFLKAILMAIIVAAEPHEARAESPKNGETYVDLIQKARNLVLQKDRQQALLILTSAIKNEKPNSKAYREIKKSLFEISRIFISEKAQQTYELSLSLKKTDLPQAQQKISDALRIEPENFTMLLESTRQALSKGDCKAAEDFAIRTQKLNAIDDELNLVLAQVKICSGETSTVQILKDAISSAGGFAWLSLEVEKNLKEKNFAKAREALNQLKKVEKSDPEIYYWTWKIDYEQKIPNLEAAQKYGYECQNLTVTLGRRLNLDPWLCHKIAETEAYIKSQPQGL